MSAELVGSRVDVIPHAWLVADYFGLKGTIIAYEEEPEMRRDPKHHNDPMPTGKLLKRYQVKFDSVPEKEMAKSLWLFRGMFKVT